MCKMVGGKSFFGVNTNLLAFIEMLTFFDFSKPLNPKAVIMRFSVESNVSL